MSAPHRQTKSNPDSLKRKYFLIKFNIPKFDRNCEGKFLENGIKQEPSLEYGVTKEYKTNLGLDFKEKIGL